jgi:cytoskeletal protein RodZ
MLALGGGAVVAGASGFFVWDTFFAAPSGEFSASEDPQTTLEEYVGALNQGDFESAEALLHSAVDANLEQEVPAGDAGASLITITIENSSVVEQTDSRAVVEGEIAVDIPLQGTETQQGEMELRKEDGVWKIYRDGFLEVGPE